MPSGGVAIRHAHWTGVGLLAVAIGVGWDALRTGPEGANWLLGNADFLSPAAVYQDRLDGRPVADFQFSAATFLLPDLLGYAVARAATGDHATAMPVWVAGLFLLLTAAGVWAGCELVPGRRRAVTVVVLSGAAAYLAGTAAAGFPRPLTDFLLPVWHNGALTLALVGLAVALRLFRGSRGWALAAFAVAAAGLFSDRLTGFYLAVPVAAVLACFWWQGAVAGGRLVLWLAATAAGGLAGLAALKLLHTVADPLDNYWTTPTVGRVGERAGRLALVVFAELRAGNPLLIGTTAWYAVGCWVGRSPVRVFSLVMLAGVTGSFLLSGTADLCLDRADWATFSRYFVGPMGAAWLGWAVTLAESRWWPVASAGAAVVVVWAALSPAAVDRPAVEWQLQNVAAVDAVCRSRGLSAGLAGYADAKPHTLLSRAGLTLRAVRPCPASPAGMTAFTWLGNPGWYGPVEFILVGPPGLDGVLPEGPVVARLGEPAERVPAGDRTVLVYNRPGDWRLTRFAELDPLLLNRPQELHEAPVVYPAAALLAPVDAGVTDTPDGSRVAEEGKSSAGLIAFGPYLRVGRPGLLRVTVAARADGPAGNARVVWVRQDGKASKVLAATDIGPDSPPELLFAVRLEPRHRGGWLEFQVNYAGRGRLTLTSVRCER